MVFNRLITPFIQHLPNIRSMLNECSVAWSITRHYYWVSFGDIWSNTNFFLGQMLKPFKRAFWYAVQFKTSTIPPPHRAFELFKIGLLKFPPRRAKSLSKCLVLGAEFDGDQMPLLKNKCSNFSCALLFWKLAHSHSIQFTYLRKPCKVCGDLFPLVS